jgi:2-keto-4-pentenoate hydratase/2-oxohepta-3-ene-1,7-dioic acid hydratase in catechol pathway
MRMASRLGRAVLVHPDGTRYIDIAEASAARFGPTPLSVFGDWDGFRAWVDGYAADWERRGHALALTDLDAPSPSPRQTFAIGLNYRSHADESGHSHPEQPPTFTKFVSSFSGPVTELVLPSESVDWEVELVVVVGRAARAVSVD